jgi:mannose-1-phosphate guanylyltransferase
VRKGFAIAEKHADALVTFAITPTSPHTGYGYVRRGREVEPDVHDVA